MTQSCAAFAPSLLTADFARLGEEAQVMEAAGADRIHWEAGEGAP